MSTDFLFDKAAIVTGASSGIGRATALALAKHGACVALAARRETALSELAREIERLGRKALILPTDVTQHEQVQAMVQGVVAQWGRVDILVSNAGEYIQGSIVDLDPADLQRSLDVNYFGGVYCIKAVLPHMLGRKSGHIIAVTSMDGKIGLPPDAPYVSAKFALTGFLEVLRQEVIDHGITVTNVLPGRVDTEMIEHLRFSWVSPKISPESVARSIVDAIRKRKPIVIVPPQAKLLYYINAFAPRLSDRLSRFFRLEGWTD
ncbi:MAG TPA: SDR family NAD(P)-dependent oxidoreductase [Anaerolineales bacterium]|nr:SDR family NAD(P)-dependent oxidoreductase [Anaerolineales bacterium]